MIMKVSGTQLDTDVTVVDSTNDTVVDGSETVVAEISSSTFGASSLKLICFEEVATDTYKYAFANFDSRTYTDWSNSEYHSAQDYSSYIETGEEVLDSVSFDKEAARLVTFFERTETAYETKDDGTVGFNFPSGCTVRAKWQWTDSSSAGRWTDRMPVYRFTRPYLAGDPGDAFDYGFEVIQNQTQLRGKGRSLRLIYESETGKDFHLLGWAIPYIGILDA